MATQVVDFLISWLPVIGFVVFYYFFYHKSCKKQMDEQAALQRENNRLLTKISTDLAELKAQKSDRKS